MGTGLGLMLRFKASTGGTDLLAQYIKRYLPLNLGLIIFLTDFIIIGAGGLLISKETFFHSILTIIAGGVATGLCTLETEEKWKKYEYTRSYVRIIIIRKSSTVSLPHLESVNL